MGSGGSMLPRAARGQVRSARWHAEQRRRRAGSSKQPTAFVSGAMSFCCAPRISARRGS
eukprot:CAMPEP_0119535164 /NCGR_PEP_ID=MMETSP1344-20130328/48260_1 /TAXON_ID=236787 /ORGANISM="Florenciella parvula, Strain CCMP2471" /LENGTH=58 /DNA_ID=CAMNT_0007576675 /DNA_START=206 /DNA_END=379 /DNA_ORIENTATION=+